jgi:L-lactate dehydrogenase complex protein LldF
VYSGPMGAVLTPLLAGLERAPALPHASSLCGACTAACPVKIPLHELLLELRRDLVERRLASRRERAVFWLWSLAWSSVRGYRASTALARLGQPLAGLVGPGRAWAAGRSLPRLARRRYRDRR